MAKGVKNEIYAISVAHNHQTAASRTFQNSHSNVCWTTYILVRPLIGTTTVGLMCVHSFFIQSVSEVGTLSIHNVHAARYARAHTLLRITIYLVCTIHEIVEIGDMYMH